ncbi:MAG: hypothetical protein U1F51_16100 [Burkholderiales bacterium]
MRRVAGDDLRVGLRFFAALPRFLRTPLALGEMRAIVRGRLASRARLFAANVARACRVEGSPYARLFAHAGLDPREAAAMAARDGVEGALGTLLRAGIGLSGDEFKGRRPVVRGSLSFTVDPATLVNPASVVHGVSESSGSRGARTPVPIDLASIRDHAVDTHVSLAAHGGRGWSHAHYGIPGGTAVTNPLEFAKGGHPPVRVFASIDPGSPELHPRYRLGARALRFASLVAGVPLPGFTLAPLDDPTPIVRWLRSELDAGRVPHLWTYASSAVRICHAARASGVDIAGARFTCGGEPTTPARRATIEATGAGALPRMGTTETDILAYACARPAASDDMHFLDDRYALIQPGPAAARDGLPPDAMILTSLLPTAPILMVNVCLGDRASVDTGVCGCPMAQEGWATRVRDVRSFEKLTAGGMTLLDVDVVRVLEEVLPGRFGGRPGDWQLVERHDGARAEPELRLLVDPSVGPLDEGAIADAFLEAVGGGDAGERMMALQWRAAGVLRVERAAPLRTVSGKILHVHAARAAGL